VRTIGEPVDCERDDDYDGVVTACDNCILAVNPGQEDGDTDGVGDACDGCPLDSSKTEAGICGCGSPDEGDADGDGTLDCVDACPLDASKTGPGVCGCHVPDEDGDQDGVPDCLDLCPDADDNIFAPGCADAIPTVSTWGVVIMVLLLLLGAKLRFGVRPGESQ
jgi:hypothetical protein